MVLHQTSVSSRSHPRAQLIIFRPGLASFLATMSESYEMHVYTMGTRSYADAICNVIDPEGKLFGGRILSRDESGSEWGVVYSAGRDANRSGFSVKNLQRLFPTDQSMVVVIDDRADVWSDNSNLVKVVPCEFSHIDWSCDSLRLR